MGFLRCSAPEWIRANHDLMFGKDAPPGMAETMVDMSLKWGRVDRWMLENLAPMVRDAVTRRVERSMDHLTVGMLRSVAGWSVAENAEFFKRAQPESGSDGEAPLLAEAARTLAAILDDDDAEHLKIALDFWRTVLADQDEAALRGFGWLADVGTIDETLWQELTLKTLEACGGRIEQSPQVASRAAAQPLSPEGVAILDLLVRCLVKEGEHWEHTEVCEIAADALSTCAALPPSPQLQRLRHALSERDFAPSSGETLPGPSVVEEIAAPQFGHS